MLGASKQADIFFGTVTSTSPLTIETDQKLPLKNKALLGNHEGRITRLENMLVNEVTGNSFLVTFEDLGEVTVTGTWNEPMAGIEF